MRRGLHGRVLAAGALNDLTNLVQPRTEALTAAVDTLGGILAVLEATVDEPAGLLAIFPDG